MTTVSRVTEINAYITLDSVENSPTEALRTFNNMYFIFIEIDSRKNLCTIDLEKPQRLGQQLLKWYFASKIVLTYCEKNCSSDWEKLFKFEYEGQEFAKILISPEQFIWTGKGQNSFLKQNAFFNLFLEVSQV